MRRSATEVDLFDLIGFRVIEVENTALTNKRRFIDELSVVDADFMIDEFDRVDIGIDTAIEIECPVCDAVQEIQLPFAQTFLLPGKGRSARRDRMNSFQL